MVISKDGGCGAVLGFEECRCSGAVQSGITISMADAALFYSVLASISINIARSTICFIGVSSVSMSKF